MELERAKKIVGDMLTHVWFSMELMPVEPADLRAYSLAEMVEANAVVSQAQAGQSGEHMMVVDDRMTAALYTITHYPPQEEMITKTRRSVLAVLPARCLVES